MFRAPESTKTLGMTTTLHCIHNSKLGKFIFISKPIHNSYKKYEIGVFLPIVLFSITITLRKTSIIINLQTVLNDIYLT